MFYDISILWFWLILAFALGAAFGYRAEADEAQDENWWRQGWFYLSLKALCGFAILAFVHIPGGRLGHWIETAVFIYGAYVLGCLAGGAWLRREKEKAAAPAAGVDGGSAPAAKAAPPSASASSQAGDPPQIARVEGEEKHEGRRPVGLVSARGGKPDDLQRIKGIGPQNQERLRKLGIWHFAQIADWTPENVQWVGSYLSFAGRIERENWIAQATQLAAGGAGGRG